MKAVFYYSLLALLLGFLVVGLWSNATDGYYQETCCGCEVDYLPENYQQTKCLYFYCEDQYCELSLISKIKLKLAELDFVR